MPNVDAVFIYEYTTITLCIWLPRGQNMSGFMLFLLVYGIQMNNNSLFVRFDNIPTILISYMSRNEISL